MNIASVFSKILGKKSSRKLKLFGSTLSNFASTWAECIGALIGANMSPADKQRAAYEDKLADENADVAYMRQKEFQDLYLSPEAQLQSTARGFDSLGLNRMLMAGNSPGASASSVPQSSGGSASSSSAIGDLIGAFTSLVGKGAEIENLQAEAGLRKETALGLSIDNRWKDRLNEADYNLKVKTAEQINSNINFIASNIQLNQIYTKYYPDLFASQAAQNNANAQQLAALAEKHASDVQLNDAQINELNKKIELHSKEMDEIDARISKIRFECATLSSQTQLNETLASESRKRIDKYEQEIREIAARADLSEKDVDWYIWNHPRSVSVAGFRFNRSSRTGTVPDSLGAGLSDRDLFHNLYLRGLISEDAWNKIKELPDERFSDSKSIFDEFVGK